MAGPLIETGPLGDKREEDRLRKTAQQRANRRKDALRWIMSDERGRLYLASLVRDSHAITAQVGRTADEVLFREGMRTMGLKVLSDVRALEGSFLTELIKGVIGKPTGDDDGGRTQSRQSDPEPDA